MSPRKNKGNRQETEPLRNAQLVDIEDIIDGIKNRITELDESRSKQLPMLDSVSEGLYEELDKLCKRAPAEPITDLVLGQVNDIIRETKSLAQTDPFVQKLNEFIPAGDNPQQRDVVVVLRQIRQGLQRCRNHLSRHEEKLSNSLLEAEGIQTALYIFIEEKEEATEEYFEAEKREYDVLDRNHWFTDDDPRCFDYEKLDKINLKAYFSDNK
jgi:hypothetical protein